VRGGRGRGGWGRGRLDPTDSTLLFLSKVRVRVACGGLLRQRNVRRLRWDAELRIGPFRLEVLRNRNERCQRRQFRLPISKRKRLGVSETACVGARALVATLTRDLHRMRPTKRREWCPCRSRRIFPPRPGEKRRRKSPPDPCRVATRVSASR
jgi:hypothetical protein